jgi:hypothetical protein
VYNISFYDVCAINSNTVQRRAYVREAAVATIFVVAATA